MLLLVTYKAHGASVAVDKSETVEATKETKEPSTNGAEEAVDPRIGLYTQQINPYGQVGPIGGNSAFYLTSLPEYGNFDYPFAKYYVIESLLLWVPTRLKGPLCLSF